MKPLKVLNLYAGIGGNRKLWQNVEVTAVEQNAEIAKIYSDFFPDDKMIVGDAHQFLLEHFAEYDFIWASPPCPTHSKFMKLRVLAHQKGAGSAYSSLPVYPDMMLYQEILLLQHFATSLWVVENVIAYYKPLIPPQESQRHWFWANFYIKPLRGKADQIARGTLEFRENNLGFDLSNYQGIDKTKALRNCVHPELGLHIFNSAIETIPPMQESLFENDESKKHV